MSCDPEPKPTSEPDMAGYLIASAARLLEQRTAGRLIRYGVCPGQLPTLLALFEEDGRIQAELARRAEVEQPTMALNLKRMERDGLVVRRPDPDDARKVRIWLTGRAREIELPIRALRREIDEEALAGIPTAARDELHAMLRRTIANLRACRTEPRRP